MSAPGQRAAVEQLVHALHQSRLQPDLERLCALFAPDARLRIVGTSDGKAVAIDARGVDQIRHWLSMLVKTFRLTDYELLSMLVDGERAVAHWRVCVRSRITGAVVWNELMDLIDTRAGRITAHTEFFVPG